VKDIGDLASLIELNLSFSGINHLPPSIERLQNLVDLDLSFTENLIQLPGEIVNLSCLIKLDLRATWIVSIHPSIGYSRDPFDELRRAEYINDGLVAPSESGRSGRIQKAIRIKWTECGTQVGASHPTFRACLSRPMQWFRLLIKELFQDERIFTACSYMQDQSCRWM